MGRDAQENEHRGELDQGRLPNVDLPFWINPAAGVVELVRELPPQSHAKKSSAECASNELTEDVYYRSDRVTESGEHGGHRHQWIDMCTCCWSCGGNERRYEDRVAEEDPHGYRCSWPS